MWRGRPHLAPPVGWVGGGQQPQHNASTAMLPSTSSQPHIAQQSHHRVSVCVCVCWLLAAAAKRSAACKTTPLCVVVSCLLFSPCRRPCHCPRTVVQHPDQCLDTQTGRDDDEVKNCVGWWVAAQNPRCEQADDAMTKSDNTVTTQKQCSICERVWGSAEHNPLHALACSFDNKSTYLAP